MPESSVLCMISSSGGRIVLMGHIMYINGSFPSSAEGSENTLNRSASSSFLIRISAKGGEFDYQFE